MAQEAGLRLCVPLLLLVALTAACASAEEAEGRRLALAACEQVQEGTARGLTVHEQKAKYVQAMELGWKAKRLDDRYTLLSSKLDNLGQAKVNPPFADQLELVGESSIHFGGADTYEVVDDQCRQIAG